MNTEQRTRNLSALSDIPSPNVGITKTSGEDRLL